MSQMTALIKKNILHRYRAIIELIFELIFPAILIIIMIAIKLAASEYLKFEEKSYVGSQPSSFYDPKIIMYPQNLQNIAPSTTSGTPQGIPFTSCIESNDTVIAFIGRNTKNKEIYEYVQRTIEDTYLSLLPSKILTFDDYLTTENFERIIRDINYKNQNSGSSMLKGICVGIEINITNKNYNVTLRYDDNYASKFNMVANKVSIITSTMRPSFDKYNSIPNLNNTLLYLQSGFIYLQNLITNKIYQIEKGISNSNLRLSIIPMRTPNLEVNNFMSFISIYFPYTLGIGYVFTIFRFCSLLVKEKELKIKEMMKLMGMSAFTYWCSWIIEYIIVSSIIALINALLVRFCLMNHSNFFLILLFYFIYEMDVFAFALMLAPFFSTTNIASIGSTVSYLLTFVIGIIFITNDFSFTTKTIFSIFSPVAGTLILTSIANVESAGVGLNFFNFTDRINDYSIFIGFLMMIINFFIVFFLGIYFDFVIPYSEGVGKPFYFIFQKEFWFPKQYENNDSNLNRFIEENKLDIKYYEKVSEILRQQEDSGECLKIRNIDKVYKGGKKAVDDVSFNIYKNQIFVLLGHNGAGKTTLISILTGIFAPTKGTASLLNFEIFKQMDSIRQMMGLCPQNDILFPSLTIREHLNIYSTFKSNVNKEESDREIQLLINDLKMNSYADNIVEQLSAGQKRCLSIAIAFIGNSSIILLDEPTSGMDITARRCVWGMLKKYKSNKIIILTTHFMEEADCLGDRIAIMNEGKIKCLGSPGFLKGIFGGGYILTISKNDASLETKESIEYYIQEYFPTSIMISNASKEIKFQLDFFDVPKFAHFFLNLDNNLENLNANYYAISNTNMEEVFLRVAESEGYFTPIKREYSNTQEYSLTDEHELGYFNIFFIQLLGLFIKRLKILYRSKLSLIGEIIIYLLLILVLCINAKLIRTSDSPLKILTLDIDVPQSYYVNSKYSNTQNKEYIKFLSILQSNKVDILKQPTNLGSSSIDDATPLKKFDEYIFETSKKSGDFIAFGSLFVNQIDTVNEIYEFTLFVNTSSQDSAGIFSSILFDSFLKFRTSSEIEVKFANFPHPVNYAAKSDEKGRLGINCMGSLTFVLSLLSIGIISFIANEKELLLKHMQKLYGLLILPYWIVNSIMDILKTLIIGLLAIALWRAFSIDIEFSWLFILLYSFAIVPYTYCFSFLFSIAVNAEKIVMVTNFFIGVFLGILAPPLQRFENTKSFIRILDKILQVFPIFSVTRAINNSASNQADSLNSGLSSPRNLFDTECAGIELIFLLSAVPFYFLLLYILESIYYSVKFKKHKQEITTNTTEDDVLIEESKAYSSKPEDATFLVKKLRKVYKGSNGNDVVALNSFSLKLEKGCVFGLLGPNGAGKSTTFALITQSVDTKGEMYFCGTDARENPPLANSYLGFCPQYNSFFPLLTTKENLEFYAKIKGVIKEKIPIVVNKLLIDFNIKQFEYVEAGTLSGGNKRKLCVAISFIGNPPIILIDELSTGVDPQAKRHIWNSISRLKTKHKDIIIILSTHSMEEAENLATKIGILIKGNLKCIGSAQEIKNRFDQAFQIEYRVKIPEEQLLNNLMNEWGLLSNPDIDEQQCNEILVSQNLERLITEICPDGSGSDLYIDFLNRKVIKAKSLAYYCIVEKAGKEIFDILFKKFQVKLEEHYNIQYKVSVPYSGAGISELFKELYELGNYTQMQEYSISPTTLDSIFNSFVFEKDDRIISLKSESNSGIHQ